MTEETRSKVYSSLPKPFGKFAHASVVQIGDKKLSFVSGVTARDSGASDIEGQTRVVYDRIQKALEAEGGGLEHIVKMNVFMIDVRDYPVTNEVREEFFGELPPPASTLVEVSKFVMPNVLIEIECIAVI